MGGTATIGQPGYQGVASDEAGVSGHGNSRAGYMLG